MTLYDWFHAGLFVGTVGSLLLALDLVDKIHVKRFEQATHDLLGTVSPRTVGRIVGKWWATPTWVRIASVLLLMSASLAVMAVVLAGGATRASAGDRRVRSRALSPLPTARR